MDETKKQELLKEKFMQFQTLQQYIEQVSEHVNLLHKQHLDLELCKETLQEFSETAKEKVLAPIANGIFIQAKTTDNQEVLVNVGAGTIVKKPVQEVIKLLSQRQKETLEKVGEAQKLLQEFHDQSAQIYKEVEVLK